MAVSPSIVILSCIMHLIGFGLVFTSFNVINGLAMEGQITWFHDNPYWIRIWLACATTIAFANLFTAKALGMSSPSVSSIIFMLCFITAVTANAIIMEGARINWHIAGGFIIADSGAAWLVYGINSSISH